MEPFYTSTNCITESDYVTYCLHQSAKTIRFWRIAFGLLAIFSIVSLFLIYYLIAEVSWLVLFSTLGAIFMFYIKMVGPKLVAKKNFKNNKLIHGLDITYSFYDDHFTMSSNVENASISYEKLYKIVIVPQYVYFHTSEISSFIVKSDDDNFKSAIAEIKDKYAL